MSTTFQELSFVDPRGLAWHDLARRIREEHVKFVIHYAADYG